MIKEVQVSYTRDGVQTTSVFVDVDKVLINGKVAK